MIKHIVMIQLGGQKRQQNAQEIKRLLSLLPEKIKEIKKYEIGLNMKDTSSKNFQDLVLTSAFEDSRKLQIYSKHPEHQKVVKFIKEAGGIIRAVDYDY